MNEINITLKDDGVIVTQGENKLILTREDAIALGTELVMSDPLIYPNTVQPDSF